MRRRTAAPLLLALLLGAGAAACSEDEPDMGDGAAVETGAPEIDLTDAIRTAQASMPIEVPNSLVGIFLEDLCAAGASDDTDIAERIANVPVADATQADQLLASLDAGTAELCPGDVAPAVRDEVAAATRAATPSAPMTSTTAATAAAGTSSGSTSPASNSTSGTSGSTGSGSSNSSTGSSGSSNTSTGSSSAGGGNATGSGNQSSTNFGQSFGTTP